MKITRFLDDAHRVRFGLDRGDGTADLLDCSPLEDPGHTIRGTGQIKSIEQRLAPVEPSNIFCIGLNYRAHAEETGAELPQHPVVFMKPTSAAIGDGQAVVIPGCCNRGDEVDYECELAVVIGRIARNVAEKDALDYVLGYTCANDISARRWQKHGGGGQWVRGKSFDTFCPLGPTLVTADEVGDPQNLRLSTTVNGQEMQDSRTSDMIFPVAGLIAFLSRDTTLLPGTVILTGTPSGVGMGRKPPVYLKAGDEVTVAVEKVGHLTNPVTAAN